jgi:hypothetical protein
MRFQTHIASDNIEGDMGGRFAERTYRVGETMAWFDANDADYSLWKTWGEMVQGPVYEYCFGMCLSCSADLYARIEFADIRVVGVTEIGLEGDWPRDPDQPSDPYPMFFLVDVEVPVDGET